MDRYTDHSAQARAWAASSPSSRDHGSITTTITTGIGWIPITMALIVTGWICSQYYHIETKDISRT
jgi:hypothetical protein